MSQTLPSAYEGEDVPIVISYTDDAGDPIAPEGASDSTGPTITITAPTSGSTIIDGVAMTEDETGTYSYVWDTASDFDGTGSYLAEVTGEFSSETKIAKATIQIS